MSKRRYLLILKRQPERILRRLSRDIRERIDQKLMSLVADPRPEGCVKLTAYENLYRVRVGEGRISYAVEDDQLIVLILEIAPRGGAYRTL